MGVRQPALAKKAGDIAFSDEIPKQAESGRLGLVLELHNEHPELSWTLFSTNLEQLMKPHEPFGTFIIAQYVPEIFWNSLPIEKLEAWAKSHTPDEMAPNIARGMETARFKVAEKALLVKSADDFIRKQ